MPNQNYTDSNKSEGAPNTTETSDISIDEDSIEAVVTVSIEDFEKETSRIQEELEKNENDIEIVENFEEPPANEATDSFSQQILNSFLPPYAPALSQDCETEITDFFVCKECKDKFVIESSLTNHFQRRSVVITYDCNECKRKLTFYNRCKLLQHCREHGFSETYSFNNSNISLSALPEEKLLIGPFPEEVSPSESGVTKSNKCASTQTSEDCVEIKNISKDVVEIIEAKESDACPECKEPNRFNDHFNIQLIQNSNLICGSCDLILPTKCSLKAHQRYHKRQAPFICPDCGRKFGLWASFSVHIQHTCFHLAKQVYYRCPACRIVLETPVKLEVHMMTDHVKNIYKCRTCQIACFTKKALIDHRTRAHGSKDFLMSSILQQCQICPDKLISKAHLWSHINQHAHSHSNKIYVYQCDQCKFYACRKSDYSSHKQYCRSKGNLQHSGILRTRLQSPESSPIPMKAFYIKSVNKQNSPMSERKEIRIAPKPTQETMPLKTYTKVKPISYFNQKNEDEIQVTVQKQLQSSIEKDPLGFDDSDDASNHQTSEGTIINGITRVCITCRKKITYDGPCLNLSQVPLQCSICSKKRVGNKGMTLSEVDAPKKGTVKKTLTTSKLTVLPPSIIEKLRREANNQIVCKDVQSKNIKASVRIDSSRKFYKCHMCNALVNTDWDAIQKHFRVNHKNFNLMLLSPTMKRNSPNQNKTTTTNQSENVRKIQVKRKSESLDHTVTSDKDTSHDVPNSPKPKRKKKGNAKEKSKKKPFGSGQLVPSPRKDLANKYNCSKCEFANSDRNTFHEHITTHKTDPNAYQCMECGLCFVVKPSFQKHLQSFHRIKDVDTYVKENNCRKSVKRENQSDLKGDDESTAEENLEENQCRVCKEKFDNAVQLNKHFRTHGMAFLKMNQREKQS